MVLYLALVLVIVIVGILVIRHNRRRLDRQQQAIDELWRANGWRTRR